MSTKSTLVYSLGINVTVITLKAVVGTLTGSAAMLAEASHSLVDSLTGPLLLAGEWHRTRWAKGPHFWGLLAAVNMALLGGGYAAWEGIKAILDPATTTGLLWSGLAVLAASASLETTSAIKAIRVLKTNPDDLAMRTQLTEDGLDVLGCVLAALGIGAQLVTGSAIWDGVAGLLIALLMTAMAIQLGNRNARLLFS